MNNPIAAGTASSAKTLAQQIAKQMAREPLEILNNAKEQVGAGEFGPNPGQSPQGSEEQKKLDEQRAHESDQLKSARRMEALKREIEDIQKQKLFKQLQEKISAGEYVPLEEYMELSMEQRQVLKAQMEAVKTRMQNANESNFNNVPSMSSKPSRRFGAGQKQAAKNEQTRVEKPVPPSG
jgi:hypothetical protein